MKRRYFCPSCDANLNPNVKIILMVRKNGEKGLILLSPQPGNYQTIVADEIKLTDNDMVSFHCPVCGISLTNESDETMAQLSFKFSNGRQGIVYFSRRYGHHATYFVSDEKKVQAYGDDAMAQPGLNFFGSGQSED